MSNPDVINLNPKTLAEINSVLSHYELPRMSPETMGRIVQDFGRDRIKKAIVDLQTQQSRGARKFFEVQLGGYQDAQDHPMQAEQETSKQPNTPATSPRAAEYPKSIHVYAKRYALCFEADQTKGGVHTVAIDAANAIGERKYDWPNKTRIQMTEAELPVVMAVFLGMVRSAEYKNHGPQKDKGFSIEDQQQKLFLKVFSPDGVKAVPIIPEDAFRVSALMLEQAKKNNPDLSGTDIIAMLGRIMRLKQ